jgi:hypothetical protein
LYSANNYIFISSGSGGFVKSSAGLVLVASLLATAAPAIAHHSYSMFDLKTRATINGTVAKVEWSNPHVFIWMYVPNAKGAHDLYAIEAGSVTLLTRYGWNRSTIKPGEKVALEYFPLKDRRPGGAFIKLTHADGSVTRNEPFAPGGTDPSAYRTNPAAGTSK